MGDAVVQQPGEDGTRDVPHWLLARDQAESVTRANAMLFQLTA